MHKTIAKTHRANILLGTLLLARDYAAKAWHFVFGPIVTDCVEHATAIRGTLNHACAATAEIDHAIADATKGDGVIDEKEAAGIRRLVADLNHQLATGPAGN